MKLCVDCKWYVAPLKIHGFMDGWAWCESPNNSRSPVDGELQTYPCYRTRDDSNKCGMDAKWFEAK